MSTEIKQCKIVAFADLHYCPKRCIHRGIQRKLTLFAESLFDALIKQIDLIMPDLVVNLGDTIQDERNFCRDIKNLEYATNMFHQIKFPFYSVVGNHDIKTMDRNMVMKILGHSNPTFLLVLKDIISFSLVLSTMRRMKLKSMIQNA